MKILYVEDDTVARTYTEILLTGDEFSVQTAENGVAGLELYRQQMFDVVLTDIDMPKMNGIELLAEIKKIKSEQPVIALSAFTEDYEMDFLVSQGFSRVVSKPVSDIDSLKEILSHVVFG